jgi:large subunit ribosomal protein L6
MDLIIKPKSWLNTDPDYKLPVKRKKIKPTMSRIGKQPVVVPTGVTVTVGSDNVITVKGPKGELKQAIDRDITVEVKESNVVISRPTDQIRHRALHGLYRSLVSNLVKGVTEGYKKDMELVGVGFKASNQGNLLDLSLGFSHNIIFVVPKELKVATVTEKGQNPKIFLEGIDKQLIGQVAAKIRSLRKPEPYKGKGVRYIGEVVRKKAGKAAGK